MILPTPKQSEEILKPLESDNYRMRPIIKNYPGYESCFVAFHPFLIIKNECVEKLKFEPESWPNKVQINECCSRLSWTEFLKLSNIKDYKSLDATIAFCHTAYDYADRTEFKKLIKVIEEDNPNIILPQVDYFPEILENELLEFLKNLGYHELLISSDIELEVQNKIDDLLKSKDRLPYHVRILTLDKKILIVQDFDQRFSYLLGPKPLITKLIDKLKLEGFFCDDKTTESWSYERLPESCRIDWTEGLK